MVLSRFLGRSRFLGWARPLSRGAVPSAPVFPMMLAVVLLLAGCADGPQSETTTTVSDGSGKGAAAAAAAQAAEMQPIEYQHILAELHRATDCVSAVESKRDFAPLRAKSPDPAQHEPYPKHLLDTSKATATEQRLITAFLTAIAPCQPEFGLMTVPAHRNITRMISDTWAQQQDLYKHLAGGLISWGVFNQSTRSNADKLSGVLMALRLTNQG
jgi:hypothetical protein